ncbi:hypothetical protein Tco_0135851 [Tanacetum coccineum]
MPQSTKELHLVSHLEKNKFEAFFVERIKDRKKGLRYLYQPQWVCNVVERARGLHVFIRGFTYIVDFMILEDLGTIINSRLTKVVLSKPFVETSKLDYDHSEGIIKFTNKKDEVAFRMPQSTKELHLVSQLEKNKFEAFFVERIKDRKKGLRYILEKRKGYYMNCLKFGQEYRKDKKIIKELTSGHVSIIKLS